MAGPADVLLDKQKRNSRVPHAGKRLENLCDHHRRQTFGGLVHQQQLRRADQSAADRKHLLLAAGKRPAQLQAPLTQARKESEDAIELPALLARPTASA